MTTSFGGGVDRRQVVDLAEPAVSDGEAAWERIGRVQPELVEPGNPSLAGDGGDHRVVRTDLGGGEDRAVEPGADHRLMDERLPDLEQAAGVQLSQSGRRAGAARGTVQPPRRDHDGVP